MSASQEFHEPVRLKIPGAAIAEIRTAAEASELLRTTWPDTRGKWYYAAGRACADAVRGGTSVHVARRIFVEAVQESRLNA